MNCQDQGTYRIGRSRRRAAAHAARNHFGQVIEVSYMDDVEAGAQRMDCLRGA